MTKQYLSFQFLSQILGPQLDTTMGLMVRSLCGKVPTTEIL